MAALTQEERELILNSNTLEGKVAKRMLEIYDKNPQTLLKRNVKLEIKKFLEEKKK